MHSILNTIPPRSCLSIDYNWKFSHKLKQFPLNERERKIVKKGKV